MTRARGVSRRFVCQHRDMRPIISRLWLMVLVMLALSLTACGGHHTHSTPARSLSVVCPHNQGFMGCSARGPNGNKAFRAVSPVGVTAPSGGLFPDVSVWQGAVNWTDVKAWQLSHRWTPAAIFKLGEYSLDSQAPRNASETARLGFWRAGYWFVRNTGCAHEASLIAWAGHQFGLKVVVLDMEVPEAGGYAHCLAAPLRAQGFVVAIYTAPGTWPGGANDGLPLWIATYGSSFCHTCLWTPAPVAWQFTDGVNGARTGIPGIGFDDVSVDLGITKLGASPGPPAPPRLICFGRGAQLSNATCKRVRPYVARESRARDASRRAYDARGCPVLAQRVAWFGSHLHGSEATVARRRRARDASSRAYARHGCGVFLRRELFFAARAHSTFLKYSRR